MDINSNFKSLINFILIYLLSFAFMFLIISYLYYENELSKLKHQEIYNLELVAKEFEESLKSRHFEFKKEVLIDSKGYKVTFLNSDREILASNRENLKNSYEYELSQNFLGIKYISLSMNIDFRDKIIKEIIYLFSIIFPITILISIFLAKLAIKPIKNTNLAIKEFIKDTTHEMNTPLSSILASCEYFDKSNLTERQTKSIDRVSMSAKVLNSLYEDLKYISFYEKIESKDEVIDVAKVLRERLNYFFILIELKNLKLNLNLNESYLKMDKSKLIRIIDNLISNAIKYSKKGKNISIESGINYFLIEDEGIGIDRENQKEIFKRFKRFDSANSGFGIGLNLVSQICMEYNIKIELKSEIQKGSKFKLKWEN